MKKMMFLAVSILLLSGCLTNPQYGQQGYPQQQRVGYGQPAQGYGQQPIVEYGVIETITVVRRQQAGTNVIGPVAGGVAGAAVGSQFGKGGGKKAMTVVGAVAGAVAGNEIQNRMQEGYAFDVRVRHDNGYLSSLLTEQQPQFGVGTRVRVITDGTRRSIQPL